MPPSKLYKFINGIAPVDSLLQGSVKFAQKNELNDPSEFIPKVDAAHLMETLMELRNQGHSEEQFDMLVAQSRMMQKVCPEFQAIAAPKSIEEADRVIRSPFYENFELLSDTLYRMAETVAARTGIQCLSEDWSCLPMWAHYAANGNGCVIEYTSIDEAFAGDDTQLLNGVHRVDYAPEQQGVTFDPVSFRSLFFTKFSDWKYEREWRIVSSITDCEPVLVGTQQINVRYIPKHHVSAVILGWKLNRAEVDRVRKIAGNTIPVYTASFSRSGLQKHAVA